MRRLTSFGKGLALTLSAIVIGGIYYVSNAPTEETSVTKLIQDTSNVSPSPIPFTYTAPPVGIGVQRGIISLGPTGFDAFIIRIDAQHNWALEKSNYGVSLLKEGMATPADIVNLLKERIGEMVSYGVGKTNIHFIVSAGSRAVEGTQKIIDATESLRFKVNTKTPYEEARLAFKATVPASFQSESFLVDMGSGITKIAWMADGKVKSLTSYGSKYFQDTISDNAVYDDVVIKAQQIPAGNRKRCFILGGAPSDLAKESNNRSGPYTVLKLPEQYGIIKNAKLRSGLNIYKAIQKTTQCSQFIFDWHSDFSIGYLLSLPSK